MNASDFERLGVFYLGRPVDLATGEKPDLPFLLDSADLTTHAVCLGMTGSGKTGLGIALLEEAAIDGIPALVLDPKGDMGNLLLTFPTLSPSEFRPWIDEDEARRQGLAPDDFAANAAAAWQKGLAAWGEGPDRIRRLRDAADFAIYTPGSSAGRPLSMLSSLDVPSPAVLADPAALRDAVDAAVAGLLALANLSDGEQSPSYILLAALVHREWTSRRPVDIPTLIRLVQNPGMDTIGVFPLDTFYPPKDRQTLAMRLNALLASPSFAAWGAGDPIDIQRLLYTPEGRPRIAIVTLAHLSDPERMFFVSLLLTALLSWMRQQSGTSSLRALLYMDEIFGYFPPSANPPSKKPMLTLLKQARAFGLGVVLATQNPVDLDYRALSNIGLWLIGRLQTARDKDRVLEGLVGASAADGIDRSALSQWLANLRKREFLVRNVHASAVGKMESRWCLSYLRGPLSPAQITALTPTSATSAPAAPAASPAPAAPTAPAAPVTPVAPVPAAAPAAAAPAPAAAPVLPPTIEQIHFPCTPADTLSPALYAQARLHYQDAKSFTDRWETLALLVPLTPAGAPDWSSAAETAPDAASTPSSPAAYAPLPALLADPKSYPRFAKDLKDHLKIARTLELHSCPALKLHAEDGETRGDFLVRCRQTLHERRDAEKERLEAKYNAKLALLSDQERRAAAKLETEKAQLSQNKLGTMLQMGLAGLSFLLGKKSGSATRAAGGIKSMSKSSKEKLDVENAQAALDAVVAKREALSDAFQTDLADLAARYDADPEIRTLPLRPRATDLLVQRLALAWLPPSLP